MFGGLRHARLYTKDTSGKSGERKMQRQCRLRSASGRKRSVSFLCYTSAVAPARCIEFSILRWGGLMIKRSFILCAFLALGLAGARAEVVVSLSLANMTVSAAQIFRGRCVTSKVELAEVAGARIPVTRYTFRISEHLKGPGPDTVTFRQVGTPEGGLRDLGHLSGLPTYTPDTEYVLFLLPESRAGLTSPAGAGDGAFLVSGEQVRALKPGLRLPELSTQPARVADAQQAPPPVVESFTYEALRRAVRELINQ